MNTMRILEKFTRFVVLTTVFGACSGGVTTATSSKTANSQSDKEALANSGNGNFFLGPSQCPQVSYYSGSLQSNPIIENNRQAILGQYLQFDSNGVFDCQASVAKLEKKGTGSIPNATDGDFSAFIAQAMFLLAGNIADANLKASNLACCNQFLSTVLNNTIATQMPGRGDYPYGIAGFPTWGLADTFARIHCDAYAINPALEAQFKDYFTKIEFNEATAGTANLEMLHAVSRYLAGIAFPNATLNRFSANSPDGETYLINRAKSMYQFGTAEYNSLPYGAFNFFPLVSVAQLSPNAKTRAIAQMGYDAGLAQYAASFFDDRIAAFSQRSYPDTEGYPTPMFALAMRQLLRNSPITQFDRDGSSQDLPSSVLMDTPSLAVFNMANVYQNSNSQATAVLTHMINNDASGNGAQLLTTSRNQYYSIFSTQDTLVYGTRDDKGNCSKGGRWIPETIIPPSVLIRTDLPGQITYSEDGGRAQAINAWFAMPEFDVNKPRSSVSDYQGIDNRFNQWLQSKNTLLLVADASTSDVNDHNYLFARFPVNFPQGFVAINLNNTQTPASDKLYHLFVGYQGSVLIGLSSTTPMLVGPVAMYPDGNNMAVQVQPNLSVANRLSIGLAVETAIPDEFMPNANLDVQLAAYANAIIGQPQPAMQFAVPGQPDPYYTGKTVAAATILYHTLQGATVYKQFINAQNTPNWSFDGWSSDCNPMPYPMHVISNPNDPNDSLPQAYNYVYFGPRGAETFVNPNNMVVQNPWVYQSSFNNHGAYCPLYVYDSNQAQFVNIDADLQNEFGSDFLLSATDPSCVPTH